MMFKLIMNVYTKSLNKNLLLPPPSLTLHHTETHYTTPSSFLVFLRTCDPA